MSNFICINCKDKHKFSPFNVTETPYINLPNAIPILTIDNKSKFIVIIEKDIKSTTYIKLDKELIKSNNISKNIGLYWTDGINMFNSDNGLITYLVKNYQMISNDTIDTLIKTIYCPVWWDELLYEIANNPLDIIPNNIRRSEEYRELIKEKAIKLDKIIKDYAFPKLLKIIRILHERQKQENEANLQRLLEQKRINKEIERKNRLIKEEQLLLEKQQKELDEIINKHDTRSLEEVFKENLKTSKKGTSYKFLAAINPDSSIIADLVMKSGEKSQLQVGIDSETNKQKIKVWRYYLNQQLEISNGIKYKKPAWKKDKVDENIIPELPQNDKSKILLNLSKLQQLQYAKIYNDSLNKIESIDTFKLDQWQAEAIDCIRSLKSCLITGPTSGGKTYVMMKGLDNIINSNNETNLVYVSPTFHLAYQTYANIKATFPRKNVAIITTELICIPTIANIFIGTAAELLNYFTTTNKNFHIGIFDEIHVASTLYLDLDNKSDLIRANAYTNLLTMCQTQVIAASATITNEQNMSKFIIEQMNKFRTEETKINDNMIKIIKYSTRIIPLLEYNYTNDAKIEPLVRDENIKNNFTQIVQPNITPNNLFLLLCKMRDRDMLPGIIFDISDDIAWKSYVDLINYIELMEQLEYKSYYELIEKINSIIDNFNSDRIKRLNTMPEEDILDSSKIKKNTSNNKRESGLRAISSQHFKTHKNIVSQSNNILERSILKFNTNPWESLCIIKKDKISSNIYRQITRSCNCTKENLFEQFPNFQITQSHVDMLKVIKSIEEIEPEQSEAFVNINIDKGSFYRFSSSSCGMEQLKAIREPGSDENSWKMRKRMIILAEAQAIHPKEIDGIIDVIMRGLEFGITIINPSLPFVIQNIILDNLRTKNMGIVFASESMSMGINYALRSVIIKSPMGSININPGKLIQMGGRCGRRGKDNQAHVIYWGINNSHEAHHTFIEPVLYPEHFIINNKNNQQSKEELATQLGAIFVTLYFEEELKKSSIIIPTNKIIDEDDEQNEKLRIKKRTIDIKLNRTQYLEPTIKILTKYMNYTELEIESITNIICKIDSNIILDSFSINSYMKSRDINLLMHLVIELHNTYAISINVDFLAFLETIVHILQTCEYRLIKLAK